MEQERIKEVYDFIVGYFNKNFCSPTYREICAGTNLASTSSASFYVNKLEAYGLIRLYRGRIGLVGYRLQKTKDDSFYVIN